jgi:hypothetical protein
MKKIIFCDIDGVLSCVSSLWRLDPLLLKRLGVIIEATDCSLVISSSWRQETLEKTIEYLSDENEYGMNGIKFPFCDRIIGVTDRLYFQDYRGNWQHKKRGFEIKKWIEDNHFTGNYVILDDDADFLEEQLPFWVATHPLDGIDDTDVIETIEILNRD